MVRYCAISPQDINLTYSVIKNIDLINSETCIIFAIANRNRQLLNYTNYVKREITFSN